MAKGIGPKLGIYNLIKYLYTIRKPYFILKKKKKKKKKNEMTFRNDLIFQ